MLGSKGPAQPSPALGDALNPCVGRLLVPPEQSPVVGLMSKSELGRDHNFVADVEARRASQPFSTNPAGKLPNSTDNLRWLVGLREKPGVRWKIPGL